MGFSIVRLHYRNGRARTQKRRAGKMKDYVFITDSRATEEHGGLYEFWEIYEMMSLNDHHQPLIEALQVFDADGNLATLDELESEIYNFISKDSIRSFLDQYFNEISSSKLFAEKIRWCRGKDKEGHREYGLRLIRCESDIHGQATLQPITSRYYTYRTGQKKGQTERKLNVQTLNDSQVFKVDLIELRPFKKSNEVN